MPDTWPRADRAVVAVVAAGTFLTLVAFTAPLATIGPTGRALGSGVAGVAWILSSMSIGLAAALLPAGTVADDVGRRRTLEGGLLLMAAGSLACAVAPETVTFVLARVVQGLGGAAITAAGLGAVAHAIPLGPRRATATGIWGASLGAGIAAGPVLAAAGDHWFSWRTIYPLLAVAAVALVWLARRHVEESRLASPRGIDVSGGALLGLGISCLLAFLVEGRDGWTDPLPLALLATGVLLLGAFGLVETRASAPMIELALLRAPAFRAATIGAVTTGTGPIALIAYMTGFTSTALGWSPVKAALLILAWSATSVVVALLVRRIPASVPGSTLLTAGLLVVGLALASMTGVDTGTGWLRFLPSLLLAGVASGVLNAALGREAVASVPAGRGGMGSGANNTARYLGSAVGVTAVTVIVGSHGPAPADLVAGWNVAALVTAATCLVGAVAILLVGRPARPPGGPRRRGLRASGAAPAAGGS